MRIFSLSVALVFSATLVGCSVAELNFAPSAVPTVSKRFNAALVSTNVTFASKAEATGKLNTAGGEADVLSLWKSTIDDSLLRMAIFRDESSNKLSLTVKVLELDLRGLGTSAKTTARYQLIDRNSGAVVYSTEIQTDGRASDYVGVNRARKSANRSVQANIEEFLRQISTADIEQLR